MALFSSRSFFFQFIKVDVETKHKLGKYRNFNQFDDFLFFFTSAHCEKEKDPLEKQDSKAQGGILTFL